MENTIFRNFAEYWCYAKWFTEHQRDIILSSLDDKQRKNFISSYKNGGWEDLVIRDEIDRKIDSLKKDIDIDLLACRCKVMSGKSVPMKKENWECIKKMFKNYKASHTYYVLGGMKAEKLDEQEILLVKN